MKKLSLLLVFALFLTSCGKEKKEVKTTADTTKTEVKTEVKEVKATISDKVKVNIGKELFTAKGCIACHQVDKKVVGPALQDIAKMYADKKGNMFDFLKGKADAIVDTDPGQVAVMKTNITGVLKDMKDEEIKALADYIASTAK